MKLFLVSDGTITFHSSEKPNFDTMMVVPEDCIPEAISYVATTKKIDRSEVVVNPLSDPIDHPVRKEN